MLKVGVTGGIGSGKSIVCKVFEILGIPVYSADYHAKSIINTDIRLQKKLIEVFGPETFTKNGYNHMFIAQLVFKNRNLLAKLNSIVHPFIIDDFNRWLVNCRNTTYCILEAAILFESRSSTLMDYTIVVDAPEKLRISRVLKRDSADETSIRERMNNQWPADKILPLADWIIINDDKNLLLPQVLTIHKQLLIISDSHG